MTLPTAFAIYSLGCVLALGYFFVGRMTCLNERNWPWPVIFLWPLLVFWPILALAGRLGKLSSRKPR